MDYKKIETFWKNTIDGHDKFSGMMTENLRFVRYRHSSEKNKIFSSVKFDIDMNVLDLGCGPGRWTIPISLYVEKVVAVDFIDEPEFCIIDNVEYHQKNVMDFETDEKFDVIFLSGILQYLNYSDVNILLERCYRWLKDDGKIVMIATVSLEKLFVRIDGNFEGCYRTKDQYKEKLLGAGFGIDKIVDSHSLYLGRVNEIDFVDRFLGSKLVKKFRYWFVKNFREYPGIPMIFICRKVIE